MNSKPPGVGVLGGSFDPVHRGHLTLAREARERLALEEVWLMPAARSPNKAAPVAGAEDRRAMLELALQDQPGLKLCDYELRRGGVSYTVNTLEELHRLHPGTEWFWLLGLDAFMDFPDWKSPERILELSHLVVSVRPGWEWEEAGTVIGRLNREHGLSFETEERGNGVRRLSRKQGGPAIFFLDIPPMDLSSSRIRQAFWRDPSVKKMLPPAVVPYIMNHHLYD